MDFLKKPDSNFQEIGGDISKRLKEEGLSPEEKRKIQDEFFQRVRDLLGIRVLGGNFWSKTHIKSSYSIGKEFQVIGKDENRNDIHGLIPYSISEFLEKIGIKLTQERIPNRADVEKLCTENNLWQAGFIADKYVFDDNGALGVFKIDSDGNIEILEDLSNITHVRVRTIKTLGAHTNCLEGVDMYLKQKALKKCDWLTPEQRKKIRITDQYIEINGLKIALFDEGENLSEGNVPSPDEIISREEWGELLEFIGGTEEQQFTFLREIVGLIGNYYSHSIDEETGETQHYMIEPTLEELRKELVLDLNEVIGFKVRKKVI